MTDLNTTQLSTVVGGTKRNDQLTQLVTTLQTSLQSLTNNPSSGGSNNTMMLVAMMMAMRPQPTVVASAPAAVAAPGPIINISTRFRRW